MRISAIPGLDCFQATDGRVVSRALTKTLERIRKWVTRNTGLPLVYIWVRENTSAWAEHWHLALHLPKQCEAAFAEYISKTLREPRRTNQRRKSVRTEGEWACGINDCWHIARDTHPHRRGRMLAAYLGKGEPSQKLFRGQLVQNTAKPVQGGKYELPQGEIVGSPARWKRFDMALPLKQALKAERHSKPINTSQD